MSSLSLAAQFSRPEPAMRAYREVYRLLAALEADLSIFRFTDQGQHYVAVVGTEADLERWQGLAFQLRLHGGTIIALADATIDSLLARRARGG